MVKNLRFLRNRKRISQNKLAEIIGVSQQSINKYENHNVEPDICTLIRMADFFETSVDFLIGRTTIDHVIEKLSTCDLNIDEEDIISNYRKLNTSEKLSVKLIMDNYLSNNKT